MTEGQAPVTTADRTPDEVRLAITGMTCASCSARIERKLSKVAGVESATVNLATEKALVSFTAPVTVEQIVAEVKKTGYGATVIDGSRPAPPAPTAPSTYAVSRESAPAGSAGGEVARPAAGALLEKLRAQELARQKVRDTAATTQVTTVRPATAAPARTTSTTRPRRTSSSPGSSSPSH